MTEKIIYLDYNATAPLHPHAKEAMLKVLELPNNASSIHSSGRAARKILQESREKILNFVNAKNLVFCGSATEANNLALAQAEKIIVSRIEHDSVYKSPNKAAEIAVDKNGVIDLTDLQKQLKKTSAKIVSIMLANNETGVIQPVQEAAKIAHEFGALIHTDAVQTFGRIKIDFENLGADLMTISGHKIGAPIGSAALVFRDGLELKPSLFGGGQEKNKRPSTENIPALAGFAASCQLPVISNQLQELLEKEIINNNGIVHGSGAKRLPNTSLISMPNMDAATQIIGFDMEGICVSSGSACSSGRVEKSRVLEAMKAPLAKNAIRISTGWNTSKKDIDTFLERWKKLTNT